MTGTPLPDELLEPLTAIVAEAMATIQTMNFSTVGRQIKSDRSSVTDADIASEAIILAGLGRLAPGTPVVSEEQVARHGAPQLGPCFFMVDPLDGTREYLNGRDEFTINLAVISSSQPILGIVAAPARNRLWRGIVGGRSETMTVENGIVGAPQPIRPRRWPGRGPVAAVSRSHLDPDTEAYLASLASAQRIEAGSAIKFCMLAEGTADIYPRLSDTSEWDVAAGHALVAAAGGQVLTPQGQPLTYGHADAGFRVPGFVAWGEDPTRRSRG